MLFNSLNFAIFFPIVFILYWFVANKSYKQQNILLLSSSYFFYACWDWRFMFLLIFSTVLDFYTGLKMMNASNQNIKKKWFWLSIIINLGFLGIFKYYNFFANSFADALLHLGCKVEHLWTIKVILPIGISFYTFHGLSYVIDIYNGKIKAEKKFIDYAVFVCFFPLLVAGPIERATHLLPQIQQKRTFNYTKAVDGLRQILWGLFKKIVIADQCSEYANIIFSNPSNYTATELLVGAVFFTFQIYGDFSGYSDIALGTARLFGIELLQNFSFPYFSRDIAEFWRRWHISLSSWFKDYLYIPLGGSKVGTAKKVRNTLIIFIVSGFWHGANWTFIAWGLLNAIYIIPSIIFNTNRNNIEIVAKGKIFPSVKEVMQITLTFVLTVVAWIFFRANNISEATLIIKKIFSTSIILKPNWSIFVSTNAKPIEIIAILSLFFLIEWVGKIYLHPLMLLSKIRAKKLRYAVYIILILLVYQYGLASNNSQFIYFQF